MIGLESLPDNSMVALAGFYEVHRDRLGNERRLFAFLTTVAKVLAAPIHEWMRVILQPADEVTWLDPATNAGASLKGAVR